MACLFAGHPAGNCDVAGDTWPVIHYSTASLFSGDRASALPFGARAAGEEPEIIRNAGRTHSRICRFRAPGGCAPLRHVPLKSCLVLERGPVPQYADELSHEIGPAVPRVGGHGGAR